MKEIIRAASAQASVMNGQVLMTKKSIKAADKLTADRIGDCLFDCRMTVQVALRMARSLADRPEAQALKPQLEQITSLIGTCDERFHDLTEILHATYDLGRNGPSRYERQPADRGDKS
jgi:hypothetical protein